MKILALEPYYGPSHKSFLDGWISHSSHDWTLLTLPPFKWKWRMRHSAITFADKVRDMINHHCKWDLLFCSDMLNLAEFLGLVGEDICQLPKVAYFHENQLTYPNRFEHERDYQYVLTNTTTALAADAVWFNSQFHRNSFLDALERFFKKMPDFQPLDAVSAIRSKSSVHYPGIADDIFPPAKRKPGPLRILWAARWEHDKNPQDFFDALKILKDHTGQFRISVVGESFREFPDVFNWAKNYFSDHIDQWGYRPTVDDYYNTLQNCDIVVSTANHEFFGISVLEAIATGAIPVLPARLAYPEILDLTNYPQRQKYFYDGSVESLADRLVELAGNVHTPGSIGSQSDYFVDNSLALEIAQRFKWKNLVPPADKALEEI